MSTTNTEKPAQQRHLLQKIPGMATSDGDGVKLTRIIGTPHLDMLDPFLMLDCFESDDASDYMGGFPRIHTAVLRPSPICSTVVCVIKTMRVMKV